MPDLVELENAQEGMELALDVISNGNVLVHKGTSLTSGLIATLQRRGISEVSIITAEEKAQDEAPSAKTRVLVRDARAGMSPESH